MDKSKTGKSEAALRSEMEVRRILAERGYETAESSRSKKKRGKAPHDNGFASHFRSFLIAVVVVGIVVFGVTVAFFRPFDAIVSNHEQQESENALEEAQSSELATLQELNNCIGAVDTSEITLDDPSFWQKYRDRYSATLACYESYPTLEGNEAKITELTEKITEIDTNIANAVAANESYQQKMAAIDAELAKNLAEIEARAKAWDEELAERVAEREAQAEANRQAYAEQRAAHEAAENAKKEQAEAEARAKAERCAAYEGKTASELAEVDSEVKSAKSTYDRAVENYNKVYRANSPANSNTTLTEEQRTSGRAKIAEAKSTMDSAWTAYQNTLNSKTSYYSTILISCR